MLRTVNRMLIIVAIGTSVVATSVTTARASTSVRLASAAAGIVGTQPTTNIEGHAATLKWVPNSVRALPAPGTCSSTNYSFLILNKTRRTQQVMYQGSPLFSPIPRNNGLYVCASGKLRATFALQANAHALLKVVIT